MITRDELQDVFDGTSSNAVKEDLEALVEAAGSRDVAEVDAALKLLDLAQSSDHIGPELLDAISRARKLHK